MKLKNIFKFTFLLVCVLAVSAISRSAEASTILSDDFNSYNLGNICGQGSWGCNQSNAYIVENTVVNEGKAVKGSGGYVQRSGTLLNDGQITFYANQNTNGGYYFMLSEGGSSPKIWIDVNADLRDKITYVNQTAPYFHDFATKIVDQWYSITIQWRSSDHKFRMQINNSGYNNWTPAYSAWTNGLDTVKLWDVSSVYGAGGLSYFDDIQESPLTAKVSFSSPASGTEITDIGQNLNVSFVKVDPAIYSDIRIAFTDNVSGAVSTGYIYSNLGTGSGSFTVPLSQFGFDYNGNWYVKAVADLKAAQLSDFIQTSDLTDPAGYYLYIHVLDLTTPFTFTDWNTWYTNNSAGGYSAPSDFGNSFVNFFTPIFQNSFNFANQVLKYFDSTEAEAKGQQLGSVFPVTDAYIKKIDLFFGGFPLSLFFKFVIIVMLSIFIIRTIFKFIPFFG